MNISITVQPFTRMQGRWHVCGIYLPEDVLKKVYHGNAARIFKHLSVKA